MIPNDFIQTLLSRVDVVEVIERYVPLKKAGTNFAACCPFHSEKTPSFTVSPSKQFYHCFGCGAHGTAIGFLMEHTGCGFVDAVGDLAHSVGLTVPKVAGATAESPARPPTADAYAVLLAASKYYRKQLKTSPKAIEYLKKRGLTGEIAAKYAIGYAPMGWQALATPFPNYTDTALEGAGLVISGDGGKRYDRFRDRIMFPIHDVQGQVIGFGGRVLDTGEPKYLNSPETSVFSKGRELYGLFQARQSIRSANQALVVEGYMDVVALAQHGIDYAVATLGTATTPTHVQKLFRQTDRVIFCFDGDSAGQRAAWRALETALPVLVDGKRVDFLFLPPEHDPDSYVRSEGKAGFERLLGDAVPLSDYLVRELSARHSSTSVEGRAALLAAAAQLLGHISAPLLATLLRKRLADTVGLKEHEAAQLLPGSPTGKARASTPAGRASSRLSVTRKAIRILLSSPEFGRGYADLQPIPEEPEAAAFEAILEAINSDHSPANLSTAALLEILRDSPYLPVLQAANASNLDLNEAFEQSDWEGQVERLRSHSRQTRARGMYERLSVNELKNDSSQLVRFGGRTPEGSTNNSEHTAEPDATTAA